jgi:hypothetical protein
MRRRLFFSLLAAGALVLMTVPGAVARHEGSGEPKQGGKAKLFGTAQDDVDPENQWNEVVSCDTMTNAATSTCGLNRKTNKLKVAMLDNELELKMYFAAPRSCGGGSPREVVVIDVDGKGRNFDLVLDGHVGSPPTVSGSCAAGEWLYQDLTDDLPRWDVRALTPGSQPTGTSPNAYIPWDVAEAAVMASFPNHSVHLLRLVEDAHQFLVTNRGCAYYDVVSLGPRTVTDWSNTAGHRSRSPNTC